MPAPSTLSEKVPILLVDDTPANLVALEATLRGPDYELLTANGADEALVVARDRELAVILLDVMIPGVDGFALARALRDSGLNGATPLLFVSALARGSDFAARAYALGAADFLEKPLDPDAVRAKVGVFAELYRSRRRLWELSQAIEARAEARFGELAREASKANARFRAFCEAVTDDGFVQIDAEGGVSAWNQGAERLFGHGVAGVLVNSHDVTARKRTLDLARESEERFRVAVMNAPLIVFKRDKDRRCTWIANPHPDFAADADGPLEEVERSVLASGRGRREEIVFRSEADARWYDVTVEPLFDACGSVSGLTVAALDVTALKQREAALAASEERYRLAMDATRLGTFDFDFRGGDVRWSARCKELFGMGPASEAPPTYELFLEGVHADDRERVDLEVRRVLSGPDAGDFAAVFRTVGLGDGVERWIRAHGRAIFEGGRTVRFIGTMLDATAEKAAEAALLQARDAAEAASRAKSAFLANISHEIRTPLNAILGFAELLRDRDLAAPDHEQFVATIQRNGRLLGRLLDDILDLSKIEAGRLATESMRCSLTSLVADVKALLSQQAREKGVALTVRTLGAVPGIVRTDPTRLKQILINMVGNAIKFTASGTVDVIIAFLPDGSGDAGDGGGGRIVFEIADTGRGITREQQKSLFQPFTQADVSTTRKFGGTGLGLVLSRRLAEALGGDVRLTLSEPGKGSTFTITVATDVAESFTEIGDGAKARIDEEAGDLRRPSFRLDGARVLVVEDAPDNRLLINRILRGLGASVELAHDGKEGVAKALASDFDVVLMDLQMPVCDGFEATAELRSRGYRKPIIALSAAAMREERERSSRAGCDDHLAKPIDVTRLTKKVRECLSRRALA